MSTVVIRPAVASERALLEALQWRASLCNADDREALLANPDAIALPLDQLLNGSVFLAEQDGQIKGFAVTILRPDKDVELDGLFVDPEHWRKGTGRLLVNRCAEMARSAGANFLHVIGNPHAEKFYTACGFETVGRQATRLGVGLLMKLPLRHSKLVLIVK